MALNLLWIVFVVALAACAVGFKKYVYFLSIGYGFAIAAGAVAVGIIFHKRLDFIPLVQLLLFVAYGARLSGFLVVRELKSANYRKTLGEATKTEKPMPIFVMVAIWIFCALLYTAQLSPVFYRLFNHVTARKDYVLPMIGIVMSAVGLYLEAEADDEKTQQKKKNPDMVATKDLYKYVRCPNYFGEIVFWTGMFVGSWGALRGAGQWIMAVVAWICIVFIMFNGAQRLEKRQNKRYGKLAAYRKYVAKTPIIIPFLPIYHLNKTEE